MKKILPALLCIALLLCACGRSASEPDKETKELYAMDTLMTLTVYGSGADPALEKGETIITELESLLSATDPASELSRLNENAGGAVSDELLPILSRSLELSEESGGTFRIDLYRLTSLWGFTTGDYRVPEEQELAAVLAGISGVSPVTLSDGQLTLTDVSLDLGAAAKGYAAQTICDAWRASGVTSAVLSLGGNVQTVGVKPDGSLWNIGIRDPEKPSETAAVLSVGETAVVTSGGYQRYFDFGGVRYCHIMDPAMGRPADNDLLSVTVVAKDGVLCDAFSTALYVMGYEKAVSFWRSRSDFEAVLILKDGSLAVTEGLASSLTAKSCEVIAR